MENRERQGMAEPVGGEHGRSLEQQARTVAQQASEQVSRVTDIGAARGRQIVESAREGAQQAAEYVQGAVEQTRETLNRYREGGFDRVKEDALSYTREQPMNALLIAAGVGLVIGWLTALGRR